MQPIATALVALAAIGGAGFVAWRGSVARLRPLPIPIMAWRQANVFVFSHLKVVLGLSAMIAFGLALQEYFLNTPGYDEWTLLIASVFWQAAMAAMSAALAVFLHLRLIGAEPYASFAVVDFAPRRRSLRRLIVLAALWGLGIWLVSYGVGIPLKAAVQYSPAELQTAVGYGTPIASFMILNLLALVRPALSSGLKTPLRAGLLTAWRQAPALYLVQALLMIPPIGFEVSKFLIATVFGYSIFLQVITDAAIVVFSLYQFLAIEAATVIFFRSAVLRPKADFQTPDGEPADYANYRPY